MACAIVARAIISSSWHTAHSQQPAIDRNVSLSIDKSGPGVIELGLVSQVGNGVTACATAPSSNVPTCFTQVNLVDVFATNSPPPGYSVTWSGLLSVPQSNAYQFYVSSDVVVNFSIDGVMYSSPAGSSVEGPPAATVVLQPYAAHAFSFNFTRPQLPQRPVSVMYGSSSQSKQHLPPLALYPSFRRVMPPLSVQVRAGRSCASASTAQLLATIATAGVPLSFQVLMKDEFGNARDVQDDANGDCRTAASCKASAFIHAILSSAPVFIFGSISNQTSSATFTGSVTPAAAVMHSFAAGLPYTGGLCATFYRTPEFYDAFAVEYASAAVVNSSIVSRYSGPLRSARWRGFLSIQSSCSVTFLVSSSNPFKILLDSTELISNRLDTFNTATAFTATSRVLTATQLSDVFIEYADVMSPGSDFRVELLDCSGSRSAMTSTATAVFVSFAFMTVPNGWMLTKAAGACASTSVRAGAGLTIMSAGIPSTFSVVLKDAFGNLVTSFDPSLLVVRALGCGAALDSSCLGLSDHAVDLNSSSCSSCTYSTDASLTAQTTPFNLTFSLTLVASGLYHIDTPLMQPGSALATTFRSCSLDPSTISYSPQTLLNRLASSCVSSTVANVQGIAVASNATPAAGSWDIVVITGFLRPPNNGSNPCTISSSGSGSVVSWLWLKNAWLLSASETQAQVNFANTRPLIEFYYVVSAAASGSYNASIQWSCAAAAAPLPSSNIFLKQPLSQDDPLKIPVASSSSTILRTTFPHLLSTADPIVFQSSSLPSPLTTATIYYVIQDGLLANEFRVSTQRRNGTAVTVAAAVAPLSYHRAYAFGAVATAVVDDLLALRPIDSFPPQNRVPVFVLGAPSPLFQQPRIVMAMPAPSGQGSVQLRYLNNVPVTSFEVTRLTFLVPIAMQLLVLLPVSACSSLSTITSSNGNGNGNGNFWVATAGSPAQFIVTFRDAFSNIIVGLTSPWDLVPFYILNNATDRSLGLLAFEATGRSPPEKPRYILRATMLQAGNYTVGLTLRSSGAVAAATTFGCVSSVVCASRSAVSFSQPQPVQAEGDVVQVVVSSFDSFGNARAMEGFSTCTAAATASASVISGDVQSVAVKSDSCQCCSSAHVVLAGGPAISSSLAPIHPVFDFSSGMLTSAAVTPDASLGLWGRGYVVQPPVAVVTSALPLLKMQLVDSIASPLWPGEGAETVPLALVQGTWNVAFSQHVLSYTIPTAAASTHRFIRARPFQLLHGALLATYYKLRADLSKTSVVLSNPDDAVACMTAVVSSPLSTFQGRSFPNLECGGSSISSYAVRYHGFIRRSSTAPLTFIFPETRLGTFFSIHVDDVPLPAPSADPSRTWVTGFTLPSQSVTAVIPSRSDGSLFHEVFVNVRGAPMTWPPPLPLFMETECRHALSVSASAGVFTSATEHALVGCEAVIFEGSGLVPPLAAGTVFYVLPDSISRFQFAVASSRLGNTAAAAQWSGGTALVLGRCGVYAPFAAGGGVLDVKKP